MMAVKCAKMPYKISRLETYYFCPDMTHAAYKLATVGIIAMSIAKVSCLNNIL